jgi:3-hydroxyisobutyrate dehydrogenase
MKIGFIGVGAMGAPMALNLLRAGHELKVHDARRERASELIAHKALWVEQSAEAAKEAELVFTCLPGPVEVDAVAHGLLGAIASGSAWFDLTTNAPERIRALHTQFAGRGVHVMDAPVSGGPAGAQSRKLALWVGGEREIFDKYLPVLSAMGDEPTYVGASGSGCIVKLVHNSASFAVQSVIAEAFTLGVKAGVDQAILFNALRQGTTGRSRTFDRLAEQFLSGKYDPAAFALRLAYKDMNLALALAQSCGVPMRMVEIAAADMAEGVQRGWGERDARIALTLQEERAQVAVAAPNASAGARRTSNVT